MNSHKLDAWWWEGIGCVLLVIFGTFAVSASGVVIGNAVFLIFAIRGYFMWKREEVKSNK